MIKYIALILISFFLLSQKSFSQNDQGSLTLKGTIKVERSGLSGAKVLVFQKGVQIKSYPADSKGKFEFSIDLNSEYEIVISKQGYYSKRLYFNTNVPKDELGVWKYPFMVSMIPVVEGFDASLLDKPIGKIMYVDKNGTFDYDEDYTFNMLKQLEALMKQYEKARHEAYKKMIAQADKAFNDKDYDQAMELYDKAIDLDPYDTYPDDQMEMIGKIIRQDQNAQKNYDDNVAQADALYHEKDYINSKKYYNRALNYVEKQYPKDQIALIDGILNDNNAVQADQAAKDKAYTDAVAAADRAFNAKQYEVSLSKFTEATNLKPAEKYPKDKIAELSTIIAQIQKDKNAKDAIDNAYKQAIAQADAGFSTKDYANARASYIKAAQIKPAEPYPKTKITEIDNLLAANKSLDEKYKGFIAVADQSFAQKEYESAKSNYTQALSIKPTEPYPASKIKEINGLLQLQAQQRQKDIEGNYARLIVAADGSFNNKDYEQARASYLQASGLKPAEIYPKNKIAEIEKILADQATKKRNYDQAIARADNNFNIEKWEDAKVDYQQALAIFPKEQYPQSRLNEIENKLLAQKTAAEQSQAREKAYNDAISQGDALFAQKKLQESRNSYSQAQAVKPNEAYPTQKIAEIDKMLLDQKMIDDKYNIMISAADKQFLDEDYAGAKTTYSNALMVKPAEAYPKQKIAEIDKLMAANAQNNDRYNTIIVTADQHFQNKKYDDARVTYTNALQLKPDEAYPKQKIAEIDKILAAQKSIDEKYNAIIASADQFFKAEKYEDAKTTYGNALQLKPTEAYPKQKISELNALLAQQMVAKAKLEQNKKQYDQLILQADAQFNSKQYTQAKPVYQQASALLPDEAYPKQKIVEIDNLLAGLAQTNQKYKDAIDAADQLFGAKSYGDALALYNQASSIKPSEVYPQNKIKEINGILETTRKNEAAYDSYIKLADAAYSSNNLETAKGQYQAASTVKPDEAYPKQRIAEIDKLMAEQARLAGEKVKLESQYKTLITSADASFNTKNYSQAKSDYTKASQLKPVEMYPKQKIAEIDKITSTLAAQQKAYDQKMTEGAGLYGQKNYSGALAAYQSASQLKPDEALPRQKIAEIQGIINENSKKQDQYQNFITQADNAFNQKNYSTAKPLYQQASSILPGEDYPKNQISRIDALVAEAAQKQADMQALIKSYQAKIAEADKLYNAKNYDKAISSYMDAKMIKGDETYPDQQIAAINTIIKNNAAKLDADYSAAMNQGDQLKDAKSYVEAKQKYSLALNLKPNDTNAKAKINEVDRLIEQDKIAADKQAKLDADYKNLIKQADNALLGKNYAAAIANYKNALGVKPDEKYPKDQISVCERKLQEDKAQAAAEEERRRQADLAASQNSFNKKDFDYKGEQRDQKFLNELAKQYPEGVTVENYERPNKKIKRVIVNHDGIAKEYIEVSYSYGTYYFRNGQNISRSIFYSETKK